MALAPDEMPEIFQDPPWLGFRHNGYRLAPLIQYRAVRGVEFPESYNREHCAILQSVLSFGLLEAVMECPVREDELLRIREDGRQVLSLDPLPELLARWVSKARMEGESLTLERERFITSLSAANTVLLRLMKVLKDFRLDYDEAEADNLPAMFCTLACLGAMLTNTRSCLYPGEASIPDHGFTWDLVMAYQKDRMLGDVCPLGWCPSTVNYVLSFAGLTSARFLFRRQVVQKAGDHSRCTTVRCALNEVDVKNYVAQHAVEDCNCRYLKPPLDVVVQLINSGTNPVMKLSAEEGQNGIGIEVADGSRTPYVAISHVWADGLGGSTETGIPECQFWRLQYFARVFNIYAFWLDALCVPKDESVRQKALKLMGRAYRDAKLVIAIDKTVYQSVSLKSPVENVLSCIFTSPWMRRMWTLQEAALADSVYFVLSDGLFPLSEIDRLGRKVQTDLALAGIFGEVFRLTVRRYRGSLKISDVAHSLKWRSTSRLSDEIPAIVSLFDVDVGAVLSAPLEQRMAILLLSIGTVPRDLPFLEAPKLDYPCFRWAPATFMSGPRGNLDFGHSVGMSDLSQAAQVTPKGLVAEYLACEIEPREFSSSERWTLVDKNSRKNYFITGGFSEITGNYRCNFLLCLHSPMPSNVFSCLAVLGEEGTIPNSDEPGVCCTYVRELIVEGQRIPNHPVTNPVVLKHIPSLKKVRMHRVNSYSPRSPPASR